MDILTKRPEGMEFKQYKALMKVQKAVIKRKLKGNIVWLAKLYPSREVIEELEKAKMMETMGRLLVTGETFRGKASELKVQ